MRLALATCSNLPDWEVDDVPFHQAIVDAGIDMARPVWDDPNVDWKAFDAVLIRTTWDYQEKQVAFNAWARRVSEDTHLVNPVDVVVWNTAKTYLRDLEAVGAPLTPTQWLDKGTTVDIAHLMKDLGWERGFLKPVVGATARETLPFDLSEEGLGKAQAHLDRLLPQESMMLQPFLDSVLKEGEYSAISFGGEFSHGVQKIPVPGDYRVQDDFGATDKPHVFSEHDNQYAGMFVLGGFLLQVFLDFYTKGADHGHFHGDGKKQPHRIPISLIAALSLHSFIEGIPVGTGAYDSAGFGTAMITGIALHEVPAAFVLVSILRANHLKNKTVIPLMLLYASMSLLGALFSHYVNQYNTISEVALNNILAIVIGSFLHISTTILFETSENHRFNRMKLTAIMIGIVVGVLNLLLHH